MRNTIKIISIILTGLLLTSVSFAAQMLPVSFGWSTDNAGYITIDVPAFDGDEVEYLLDLYKDGVRISDDFGVYFDESGEFESEIFADTIEELGNGTYKYKIGFERDFDTDILVNATAFSNDYVVTSYSHSVEIKPSDPPATEPAPTPSPTEVSTPVSDTTAPQPDAEDTCVGTIIKGQVVYANKYQNSSANAFTIVRETKPLAMASISLYKKNGVGNSLPLASGSTDINGNFELTYKPGNYDLIIYYGNSNITVNVDVSDEIIDLGTIKFEPYNYIQSSSALILPYDAKVVEITNDNLNDYFENIKVIGETETDSFKINTVKPIGNNVYCGITLPPEMSYADLYDMSDAFGNFDEENELWLIAPNNAKEFIRMTDGVSKQINGIYDEINNVLYHSTLRNDGSGYVFSHFGKNGTVSITKYEKVVNGLSQNATYKTTHITAGFKNLPYVTVSYNSELVGFDQKPIIENGRTLVPLRAIFEKIGATVEWNGDTQTVTAIKDDVSISLTIDNTTAYKNGQTITLDVPAKIINGRTLVPVRFVADCFGVDVQWNGDIQRVILTK